MSYKVSASSVFTIAIFIFYNNALCCCVKSFCNEDLFSRKYERYFTFLLLLKVSAMLTSLTIRTCTSFYLILLFFFVIILMIKRLLIIPKHNNNQPKKQTSILKVPLITVQWFLLFVERIRNRYWDFKYS